MHANWQTDISLTTLFMGKTCSYQSKFWCFYLGRCICFHQCWWRWLLRLAMTPSQLVRYFSCWDICSFKIMAFWMEIRKGISNLRSWIKCESEFWVAFFKKKNFFSRFSAPVSLNAAIFTSILLGSRLQSSLHVFSLLIIAIELFALFPILRHHAKVCQD